MNMHRNAQLVWTVIMAVGGTLSFWAPSNNSRHLTELECQSLAGGQLSGLLDDHSCATKTACITPAQSSCGDAETSEACGSQQDVEWNAGNSEVCSGPSEGNLCEFSGSHVCKVTKPCYWQVVGGAGACVVNPGGGTSQETVPAHCQTL